MPIYKNQTVFAIARNIKAFLNLQAGVTRGDVPGLGSIPAPPGNNAARAGEKLRTAQERLKQTRQQLASKNRELEELRAKLTRNAASDKATDLKPENLIWLFGHGRSGSTWLVNMMRDLKCTIWADPRLGDLFGHLYYERSQDRHRNSPHFVLGSNKETWLNPMRSFILETASLRFPRLKKGGAVVVKEIHATLGAPLLMEALPDSKMILLVRDPRDVVASHVDASKPESWVQQQYDRQRAARPATAPPDDYVQDVASSYLRDIDKARQAYDAHQGPKALIRYEDMVADTLGTMRRLCSDLGLAVEKEELARAVEKHAWENVPEQEKGQGKFYRKGTPGGWKEDLTPRQVEIVERVAASIFDWFYSSAAENGAAQHPFAFRPGTFDEAVFRSVSVRNEYELPEAFQPDDIIVDIGVHIGSFCYAALQRGSDHVYGFEAEKSNYACAVRNLRSFGDRVRLHNKAVWRSDRVGDKLSFIASTDESNTAGGNVIFADTGEEVETVAFDDIIRELTANGEKRVRMLKMDCEGSEFPILLTSQTLHLVDEIRGEYHEFGGDYDPHSIPEVARVPGYDRFTIKELTEALEQAGFNVASARSRDTNLGHFFATRIS